MVVGEHAAGAVAREGCLELLGARGLSESVDARSCDLEFLDRRGGRAHDRLREPEVPGVEPLTLSFGCKGHRLGERADVNLLIMVSADSDGHSRAVLGRVRCPVRWPGSSLRTRLSGERAAENESIFRDANERVEERLGELTLDRGRSPFLCECEDLHCREMVRLTREEYESVRSRPNRFVLVCGHSFTEAHVLSEADRFQVVEKTGRAGDVAAELDPRSGER